MKQQYAVSDKNYFKQSAGKHWAYLLWKNSRAAANSACPKCGVWCSKDSFAGNQTFVFQINFCDKNSAIRVAANRFVQVKNQSQRSNNGLPIQCDKNKIICSKKWRPDPTKKNGASTKSQTSSVLIL